MGHGGACLLAGGRALALSAIHFDGELAGLAAASFGGTSGLAWMAQLLRDERRFPPHDSPALRIRRSAPWLAAGVAVALLFVGALGPGIRF